MYFLLNQMFELLVCRINYLSDLVQLWNVTRYRLEITPNTRIFKLIALIWWNFKRAAEIFLNRRPQKIYVKKLIYIYSNKYWIDDPFFKMFSEGIESKGEREREKGGDRVKGRFLCTNFILLLYIIQDWFRYFSKNNIIRYF